MEAWIFDHKVFFGQTADINSPAWSNLLSYVSRPYKIAALDGTEVNIAKIAIDTSYNPSRDPTLASPELRSEVNTAILFTTLHPEYFVPVKGIEEGKNKLGATLTQRAHKTYGCVFYLADVGAIKDEIFEHIDEAEGAGAVHFSQDFDEAFFRQFASEYYGEDEKGKTGWHKLTERNETLDCFVYSRAAAQICGYDIWSEDDWLDFRDQILSE